MGLLLHASGTPGSPGHTPDRWPDRSQLILDSKRPTLVLFAHPRCSCTRATLAELSRLMAECRNPPRLHIVFVQPAGSPDGWTQTDLWKTASGIEGAGVCVDRDEKEAQNFGAETSGHIVLYSPAGRLLFQGGITIARGHEGDNPGHNALVALLDRGATASVPIPIFGCPLATNQVHGETTRRIP